MAQNYLVNFPVETRPVARIFRRGVTWMCNLYKHTRFGGSGGMLPQEIFLKLDALRLLLRPFWDRNIAIIATWLAEYCI